jgi:hypothetical protein
VERGAGTSHRDVVLNRVRRELTAKPRSCFLSSFEVKWSHHKLGDIYERMAITMAPADPGGLLRDRYASVLAYFLSRSGYPEGATDLPAIAACCEGSAREPGGCPADRDAHGASEPSIWSRKADVARDRLGGEGGGATVSLVHPRRAAHLRADIPRVPAVAGGVEDNEPHVTRDRYQPVVKVPAQHRGRGGAQLARRDD